MTELYFNPKATLLIFSCAVEYRNVRRVWLALDTGSSFTVVRESILQDVGYTPELMKEFTSFGDTSQAHLVPKVTLKSLSLADAAVDNLEVLGYTLPAEHGIDGIIGLNFLRHFNIGLNFEHGILTLNRFS
jgi:predicted aspartyl protease